ncbi:ribosomal large subunit pseudouridine synthase D [Spirochaetia bacterium]|nr:ribosomal large subunit pseudouridine synthase D [Spirochaetia bacterium]
MPSCSGIIHEDIELPLRLDRYIAEHLKLMTRSQVKTVELQAVVNGKSVKNSRPVLKGDHFDLKWKETGPSTLVPEDLTLDVLYEDSHVIVINKQQGMVVHPAPGNRSGTVANALLYRRCGGVPGEASRPGIVHRLDKDTSGVLIAAYDADTLLFLTQQFSERFVRKYYLAVVYGKPREEKGRIETLIARDPHDRKRFAVRPDAGKYALTEYRILQTRGDHSLLLLQPKTGRTHQIRVHLRHIGHPILGDPLYGKPDPDYTLMLHALSLSLRIPGADSMHTFHAPAPDRFKAFLAGEIDCIIGSAGIF